MKKGIAVVLVALLLTGCSPLFAGDTSVNLPVQEKLLPGAGFSYTYNRPALEVGDSPLLLHFDSRVDSTQLTNLAIGRAMEAGVLYAYQAPIPNETLTEEQAAYEKAMQQYEVDAAYWAANGTRLVSEHATNVKKYLETVNYITKENKRRNQVYDETREAYEANLEKNRQMEDKNAAAAEFNKLYSEWTNFANNPDNRQMTYPAAPRAPSPPVKPTEPLAERMLTEVALSLRHLWLPKQKAPPRTVVKMISPPATDPTFFLRDVLTDGAVTGSMLYFGGKCYFISKKEYSSNTYGVSMVFDASPFYRKILSDFKKQFGEYQEVTITDVSPFGGWAGFSMSVMFTTNQEALEEVTTEEAEGMVESLDKGTKYSNINVSFRSVVFNTTTYVTQYMDEKLQYVKAIRVKSEGFDELYEYVPELGSAPIPTDIGARRMDNVDASGYQNLTTGEILQLSVPVCTVAGKDSEEGKPAATSTYNWHSLTLATVNTASYSNYSSYSYSSGSTVEDHLMVGKVEETVTTGKKKHEVVTKTMYDAVYWHASKDTVLYHKYPYQTLLSVGPIEIPPNLRGKYSFAYAAITNDQIIIKLRSRPPALLEQGSAKEMEYLRNSLWYTYTINIKDLSVASGNIPSENSKGYAYEHQETKEVMYASEVGQVDLYGAHSVTLLDSGDFLLASLTNGVVRWKQEPGKEPVVSLLIEMPTYRIWHRWQSDIRTAGGWQIMAFEDTANQYTYADLGKIRVINIKLDLPEVKREAS